MTPMSIFDRFFRLLLLFAWVVLLFASIGTLVSGVPYLQAVGATFLWAYTVILLTRGALWGLDKYLDWKTIAHEGGEA